jgi:hypothetical protein
VFGREKSRAAQAARTSEAQAQATTKDGGKGKATPKRREAQARNRVPLVGPSPAAKGATKEERKAAREARRAAIREQRLKAQEGAARGDDRYLPARDRGPGRRLARDIVDSRRNLAEFFLPVAFISLALNLVSAPAIRLLSPILLYTTVLVIGVDSYLMSRKVVRIVTEKHGASEAKGTGGYAVMRAIQFRRGRRPLPRVNRGAKVV